MDDKLLCITSSQSRGPRFAVRGRPGDAHTHTFTKSDVPPFRSRASVANQNGFTLLEIIISVVVVSIIAVIAGVGFIEIAKGYAFSRKNAVAAQQGQIAMARLKKEISNIQSVISGSANSITYARCSDNSPPCAPLKNMGISWAGGTSPLLIGDANGMNILVGPVSLFSLTYYYYNPASSSFTASSSYLSTHPISIIEVTLQWKAAEDTVMSVTDRVNLYQETGG